MKMKFWDRLILFLGALLVLAAGAVLIIAGLQFTGVLGETLNTPVRVCCIAGGALLIIFAGYLMLLPGKYAAGRHSFIVQQTDNGELRIAVKAIENLVQKCVDKHEEIELNAMHIRNAREGVTVDMSISLANNISIPLTVASLQKQIKQYLVASSGIEVKEVRVSVETAGGANGEAQEEPELVPQEEAEKEKPAPEPVKAKVPLHQRIFGRQEQPATVPEPPKAEAETPAEEAPAAEAAAEKAAEEAAEEVTEKAAKAIEEAAASAEEAAKEIKEAVSEKAEEIAEAIAPEEAEKEDAQ